MIRHERAFDTAATPTITVAYAIDAATAAQLLPCRLRCAQLAPATRQALVTLPVDADGYAAYAASQRVDHVFFFFVSITLMSRHVTDAFAPARCCHERRHAASRFIAAMPDTPRLRRQSFAAAPCRMPCCLLRLLLFRFSRHDASAYYADAAMLFAAAMLLIC